MRNPFFAALFTAVVSLTLGAGPSAAASQPGETLFKQHCAACHPGGGNIINPSKTLHKKDLEENKITTSKDIVMLMRNPGPGMSKFDAKLIPDKEALQIGEYVIKTFK